jgi:hypothetical protein
MQTVVLAITAILVWLYTRETARLRREIVRQNEISLRPVVVPIFDEGPNRHIFKLRNVGGACAFNLRVQPMRRTAGGSDLKVSQETRFDSLDYLPPGLPSGELPEIHFKQYSNGQPETEPFLQHWLFPASATALITMRIQFDDVEGGGYEQEISIEPPTSLYEAPALQIGTSLRNVALGGIKRRTR